HTESQRTCCGWRSWRTRWRGLGTVRKAPQTGSHRRPASASRLAEAAARPISRRDGYREQVPVDEQLAFDAVQVDTPVRRASPLAQQRRTGGRAQEELHAGVVPDLGQAVLGQERRAITGRPAPAHPLNGEYLSAQVTDALLSWAALVGLATAAQQ